MAGPGYDPDEPEGGYKRSSYMSGKEFRIIFIAIVLLILFMWPIWQNLKEDSERFRCKRNFQEVFKAVGLYAADWNDRYPPLYARAPGEAEAPMLDSQNRPFTWASLVQRFASEEGIFRCPSADRDEILVAQDPTSGARRIDMTYGMYVGLAAEPLSMVRNPATTILMSETSNHGANGTYNPVPLRDSAGNAIPYDGFFIGYDTDNFTATAATTSVTRLAFRDTKNGQFTGTNAGRHRLKNHFLFASGQVGFLTSEAARVRMLGSDLTGYWERP